MTLESFPNGSEGQRIKVPEESVYRNSKTIKEVVKKAIKSTVIDKVSPND